MRAHRQTTVLFADVTDSLPPYESVGDREAADAIARCIERLCYAAEASGGRVVKTIGDETVNIASRLVEQALAGQALTSADTV